MLRRLVFISTATLAAAVALLWPPRPTWQVAVGLGDLLGFAPDSDTVYRADIAGPPAVVGHDATGRERSRVVLADFPAGLVNWPWITLSADATRAVVVNNFTHGDTLDWVLYDATTGRRITPPLPRDRRWGAWFSPDGRWLCVSTGVPSEALFDAATGAAALAPAPAADATAYDYQFRSDGAAVAVLWERPAAGGGPARRAVELIALPSGRSMRRVELPWADWTYLVDWQGDRLTARVDGHDGTGTTLRYVALDVAATDPGSGAVEVSGPGVEDVSNQWRPGPTGPGWASRVFVRYRSEALPSRLAALAGRFKLIDYAPPTGSEQRVRIVDPASGATRSEVPAWVSRDMRLSPDGRRLADLRDTTLCVWPTAEPWPRGAVAVIAAGAVLMCARRGER